MTGDIELKADDLNIIIGEYLSWNAHGIYVWHPRMWAPRPGIGITDSDLIDSMYGQRHARIPYPYAGEVIVNGVSVWKNRDVFDLKALGLDAKQNYIGFGQVSIHLRADQAGIEEVVDTVLAINIGLMKTDS